MSFRKILFLFLLYIVVYSCTDENDLLQISIGDNFIQSQTSFVIIDTFSVKMSTVIFDSIPTSGMNEILVGEYTDELLGKVSSTSYFQLGPSILSSIEDDAVFDSLVLVLNYSGQYYGDTLSAQTINVHRLSENIELNDDYLLYNTSSFSYYENLIGTYQFYPEPNSEDDVHIKLDDDLGIEFMNLLKENDDKITVEDDFLEYFNGLALVPGENSSSIVSFSGGDSLVNIVLYTHYVGLQRTETSYEFPLNLSSYGFNHIEADRMGTQLENLSTQSEELNSIKTGDMTFLQGGLGIVTRLDFPGLSRMLEMDFRNILYKAELTLNPIKNIYSSDAYPEEIMLYKTDYNNNLGSELVDSNSDDVIADFYLDEIYNVSTFYKFDITEYIVEALSYGYVDPENGLIVSLTEDKLKGSLDRVAFDARNGMTFEPTLKLYYIFYN